MGDLLFFSSLQLPTNLYSYRVAKCACPRVLDDQKMSEHNQKLRSGCPPHYQIFELKYFENNCPYKFFKDFILTLFFSNKHTEVHLISDRHLFSDSRPKSIIINP